MNTMLKNNHDIKSFYVQNPIEIFDGIAEEIELLLPFEEYVNTTRTTLGVPMTIGTFYNEPGLSGVPEERLIKLNELSVNLTELKSYSSMTYRGLEFKIPMSDFESILIHKVILKVAEDNRYESFVEISYDYDFSNKFLIDFLLNYED